MSERSTLDPGSKQILNTCLLHRGLNFTGVHKGRQDTGYSIVKRLLGLGTGDLDWGMGLGTGIGDWDWDWGLGLGTGIGD